MLIVDDKIMRQSPSTLVCFEEVQMIGGQVIVTVLQCAWILLRPMAPCEKRTDGGYCSEYGERLGLSDPILVVLLALYRLVHGHKSAANPLTPALPKAESAYD